MRRSGLLVAPVVCLALVLAAGCSAPTVPPSPSSSPAPPTWPEPAADRPVVDLSFVVAEDLSTATGTERVSFTPGEPVCEVVFRAWPNKPSTAATGNSLTVKDAWVDGEKVPVETERGGAPPGSPGTLVILPLETCTTADQTLEVELDFALTLGEDTDERVGFSAAEEVAWFGTAYPLLAWDGSGWATDAAVSVAGETATSVAFELASLTVTASSRFEVTGVGSPVGTTDASRTTGGPGVTPGSTEHRFTAPVVRDVTFTVGELDLVRTSAEGFTVTVAVPAAGSFATATAWAEEITDVTAVLVDRFGPLPYDELWVNVLPGVTDGVEYSGAVQFGDVSPRRDRWLLVHEVAHQWFYGLVGNNQAQHPWLDEALANFTERVVSGDDGDEEDVQGIAGAVGEDMEYFAGRRRPTRAYLTTVYEDGGRALVLAREAAGSDEFDEALRGYLWDNAHDIATPDDLAGALADLPEALEVLRENGMLPPAGG